MWSYLQQGKQHKQGQGKEKGGPIGALAPTRSAHTRIQYKSSYEQTRTAASKRGLPEYYVAGEALVSLSLGPQGLGNAHPHWADCVPSSRQRRRR